MGDINDDNDDNVLIDNFDDMSYEMPQTEFEVLNLTEKVPTQLIDKKSLIKRMLCTLIILMPFLVPILIGIILLIINNVKFLLAGILLIAIPVGLFGCFCICIKS